MILLTLLNILKFLMLKNGFEILIFYAVSELLPAKEGKVY